MNLKNNSLLINSILIIVSTTIIGTILHELAHYFTALHFNMQPHLHHNYVHNDVVGTPQQEVLMVAAGPMFSLLFGIVVSLFSIKYIKPSLLKMFLLWLGMGCLLVFFGYIFIAPVAKNGDTGKIFEYFAVPMYLTVILSIASFIFMNWLISMFAYQFVFYKNEETFSLKKNIRQLFLYPILLSIVIMTLLNLPTKSFISLSAVLFLPMTYFSAMGKYKSLKITDANLVINKVPVVLVITTILLIAIFRYLI